MEPSEPSLKSLLSSVEMSKYKLVDKASSYVALPGVCRWREYVSGFEKCQILALFKLLPFQSSEGL